MLYIINIEQKWYGKRCQIYCRNNGNMRGAENDEEK